jgi:hypothetical protein
LLRRKADKMLPKNTWIGLEKTLTG